MRATLFDHGAGNVHSLAKALERAGARVTVESDTVRALDTDLLVLPGVGAFGAAAERLAQARDVWRERLAAGLPCLGVCLGMQLLFEASDEGPGAGLGVFGGRVTRLAARRVPHMGWNALEHARDCATLATAYFAHGYACRPVDPGVVTAWCTHEGDRFPAAVRRGNVLGIQFHPEKSSAPGVDFLARFVRDVATGRARA
jgi:glutamine amidotransferase